MRYVFLLLILSANLLAQAQTESGNYTISGRVVDEATGLTLPGIRVALGNSSTADPGMQESAFSDPDGNFEFKNLPVGKYRLYAEAPGYPLQGFEAHLNFFLTGIVVGPDQNTRNIVFRLHRAVWLSGIVTDENNDPVRDATVMIFFQNALTRNVVMHVVDTKTDDLGTYRTDIPFSGTLYIGVVAKPWYAHALPDLQGQPLSQEVVTNARKLDVAYPVTYYSGSHEFSSATPLRVRYGDSVTADVHLQSVPGVHLRLSGIDRQRIPAYRTDLKVATTGGHEIEIPTDKSLGTALAGFAPGPYVLYYTPSGQRDGSPRRQQLYIGSDMTIDPEALAVSTFAKVSGTVKLGNEKDKLPSRALMMIRGRGTPPVIKPAWIAADGKFEFDELPPGEYELAFQPVTGLFPKSIACVNARCSGHTFTVDSAAHAELTVNTTVGYGSIDGFAREGGKGASGTLIALIPPNGSDLTLYRFDQSDSDGSFHLNFIAPGHYTLVSIRDGWDLDLQNKNAKYLARGKTLEVTAGGTYKVEIVTQKK